MGCTASVDVEINGTYHHDSMNKHSLDGLSKSSKKPTVSLEDDEEIEEYVTGSSKKHDKENDEGIQISRSLSNIQLLANQLKEAQSKKKKTVVIDDNQSESTAKESPMSDSIESWQASPMESMSQKSMSQKSTGSSKRNPNSRTRRFSGNGDSMSRRTDSESVKSVNLPKTEINLQKMTQILTNDELRYGFATFMVEEIDAEDFTFLQGVNVMLNTCPDEMLAKSKQLLQSFFLQDSQLARNVEVSAKKLSTRDEESRMLEIFRSLDKVQIDVIAILAMRSFPRFLKSELCKNLIQSSTKNLSVESQKSRKKNIRKSYKNVNTPLLDTGMSIAEKVGAAFTAGVLDPLLISQSWLSPVLLGCDNLPVPLALVELGLDEDMIQINTFSIVYTNAMFETCTGFSRLDMVGTDFRTCGLIGDPEKEKPSTEARSLFNAMQKASVAKVTFNCYRKDGSSFQNIICTKPVYDQFKIYRYSLCAMFDADGANSSFSQLQLMDQMIRIFPETIIWSVPE